MKKFLFFRCGAITRKAARCFAAAALLVSIPSVARPEALRIAYTSIAMVYGPLWLTEEAGLFKKYNIDPEFIYIAGGPPSLQALIAGDVSIAFTAGGATVAANLNGADVVLLGASIDSLPFELWSTPNIKTPEQLKGTRLGVSRIGATTDFVARYLLKKWNLQPDKDVAIFQTGSGPQVFAAIKGGSVQSGVLSTGPETLNAEAAGYVRLADVSASGLLYPFGPFAARQAFLKSQPDLVLRFTKAYVEAIHRFKTDKSAALAVLEKYTKQKTTPGVEKIYEIYATKYFKRAPEATPAAIQTILEEISASRPLPPGIKPERFAESRFIRELVSSGFVDRLYKTR
ncbi:MAG TPA: ABC transporter substrate-binding protein [Candidatus Limnocylindria bacterium]|nr:ABC transporter substrate-binding protein [Candidatus Limnocylindria bacterium]